VDGPGGTTGLTKSGTGTWLLTSPNANTGTVTVGNGTLVIGASSPAGGPGPLGSGATPVLLGLATGAAAASILLKGEFAIGRDITVQANAGTNTVGTFDDTPGSFTGNLLLNNTLTIQAGTSSAGSVTFSTRTISGTGSVNVNGPGTTFLLSANTYTGGTILNGGVTVANNPSSLGDPARPGLHQRCDAAVYLDVHHRPPHLHRQRQQHHRRQRHQRRHPHRLALHRRRLQ
jgi:fibronectin-binding autotransporter adhesin